MGIKGYFNRRGGYEKLDASGRRRRKSGRTEVAVEPPSSLQKRRRSWRIKLTVPLKLDKLVSVCEAKKFCVGLRDSYVDFMNRNAEARVMGDGIGGGYGGVGVDEFGIERLKALKEYDQKMIMEMYKSVAPIV